MVEAQEGVVEAQGGWIGDGAGLGGGGGGV